MTVKLEWLGNAAFRMTYKETVFFVDPWLDENPGCPLKTGEVKRADLLFVTHGHPGHWGRGDSVKIANTTGALYVAPKELCNYFVSKKMLPDSQVYRVEPGKKYEVKGLPFEVFSAPHPPIPLLPAWLAEVPGEPNCGYVWSFGSKVILNIGDAECTPLFEEIGRKYKIDMAMLPLWGEGMGISMEHGVGTCTDLIAALKPAKVFPTNRYSEDNPAMRLLASKLQERRIKVEVFPQRVGLTFEI
jgi:L-ascorbate metabolism protein UlaG (beta-lactamase superfamily)